MWGNQAETELKASFLLASFMGIEGIIQETERKKSLMFLPTCEPYEL